MIKITENYMNYCIFWKHVEIMICLNKLKFAGMLNLGNVKSVHRVYQRKCLLQLGTSGEIPSLRCSF